ncbi:hypothetical protein Ga0100231_023800 [Opitutaceae bacterium TAV4]|nr:hypothetical protein Ga0100231_023800 [Opitutaceae bacterium TAV4]RRK00899.1 hypothetical protein Ga0100230_024305 [Opitutaceae bacterium TAV3]
MSFLGKLFAFAALALLLVVLSASMTPAGRAIWNNWFFAVQKADDATRYSTRRTVEDTCRAMQASYEADRLTYSQYKDGEADERGWAAQAKMRANRTAATYNKYVLENSFVWSGNVPADINQQLPYIK